MTDYERHLAEKLPAWNKDSSRDELLDIAAWEAREAAFAMSGNGRPLDEAHASCCLERAKTALREAEAKFLKGIGA